MSRRTSRRASLPYTEVGSPSFRGNDIGHTVSEGAASLERGRPIWIAIGIPFQGRIIGHSFLIKMGEDSLMVADINGDECYTHDEYNRFYKPVIDGIRERLAPDGSLDITFLSGPLHRKAKLYATQSGPSDGGCSQYCSYLVEHGWLE